MTQNQKPFLLRYSDDELNEFKLLFEQKLETNQKELKQLESMLSEEKDRIKKEQIQQMLKRHKEFVEQINKTLLRIEAKTYGISKETGKLIDREKLLKLTHGKRLLK